MVQLKQGLATRSAASTDSCNAFFIALYHEAAESMPTKLFAIAIIKFCCFFQWVWINLSMNLSVTFTRTCKVCQERATGEIRWATEGWTAEPALVTSSWRRNPAGDEHQRSNTASLSRTPTWLSWEPVFALPGTVPCRAPRRSLTFDLLQGLEEVEDMHDFPQEECPQFVLAVFRDAGGDSGCKGLSGTCPFVPKPLPSLHIAIQRQAGLLSCKGKKLFEEGPHLHQCGQLWQEQDSTSKVSFWKGS